jgi:glutathione S-transferase
MQIMAGTPFQNMNPLARIPTLEVDGKFLGESTTICEYLDERYPDPPLLPADLYDRARVRLLCRMCDLYVGAGGGTLIHQIDPLTRNRESLEETKEYLKVSLWELDQLMGAGPWAYGQAVSLADCVMFFTLLSLQNMLYVTTTENLGLTAFDPQKPFSEYPKLSAWWVHLQDDVLFGPTMRSYVADAQKVLQMFIPDRSPAAFGIFMRARAPRP